MNSPFREGAFTLTGNGISVKDVHNLTLHAVDRKENVRDSVDAQQAPIRRWSLRTPEAPAAERTCNPLRWTSGYQLCPVLPLHAASSGGNDLVANLLMDSENGADVNAPRLARRYSDRTQRQLRSHYLLLRLDPAALRRSQRPFLRRA